MAEKRMFSSKIVDSDAFLDMPLTTQALYFHLCMRADDKGFLNNARKIQRMIGASEDDLKVLIMKRFVIAFESGVIVIKHWNIHNSIRKDRMKETQYIDEMHKLYLKENGAYTDKIPTEIGMSTTCQPNDNQVTANCQHRLDKIRLDKNSIDKIRLDKNSIDKNRLDKISIEENNIIDKIYILLKGGGTYEVEDGFIKLLQAKYPNLNIYDELSKMSDYFKYTPEKMQTMATIKQYIIDWFSDVYKAYEVRDNG